MEGNVFLGPDAKERDHVISARDRCDGTVDRIRSVRTKTHKYIRNYHPDRPYMQYNRYKEQQYPLWTLAPMLEQEGKLTTAQAKFVAKHRPYEELYDLDADPHEIENLVDSEPGILAEMSGKLDAWIDTYGDQGAVPEDPAVIAEESAAMYGKRKHCGLYPKNVYQDQYRLVPFHPYRGHNLRQHQY